MAFSVKSKQSQYIRRVNHDCRRRRAGPGGVTDATARANQVRWFDPTVGRWLSEDPAEADPNLYRYCGNGPTDGTDPSGMEIRLERENKRSEAPRSCLVIVVQ